MPRGKDEQPCRWWMSTHNFDETSYYAECPGQPDYHGLNVKLTDEEEKLAIACWKHQAHYCPFCGCEIDWCEEDEVTADDLAEHDHRMGVRYGTWL